MTPPRLTDERKPEAVGEGPSLTACVAWLEREALAFPGAPHYRVLIAHLKAALSAPPVLPGMILSDERLRQLIVAMKCQRAGPDYLTGHSCDDVITALERYAALRSERVKLVKYADALVQVCKDSGFDPDEVPSDPHPITRAVKALSSIDDKESGK